MLLNLFKKEPCTYLVEADRPSLYHGFKKNINVCEIGVQTGANAFSLYKIIQPKKLYLIDPWKVNSWEWLKEKNKFSDELIKLYKETLIKMHPEADIENPDKSYQYFYEEILRHFKDKDGVEVIRKFSEDSVNDIPDGSLELLYVDGNHSYEYVYRDLSIYEKKLNNQGIIMGNDFLKSRKDPTLTHYEVIPAVLDFCRERPEWHIFVINNDRYADFILSRDVKFDREFLRTMKQQKQKIKKLNKKKLDKILTTSEEIDFSILQNGF